MGLLDDIRRTYERVYRNPTIREIREGPTGQDLEDDPFVAPFVRKLGLDLGETPPDQVERRIRTAADRGEISVSELNGLLELLQDLLNEGDTMPVSYSDWVSIAFEIARQKGFRASSPNADNSAADMIALAAEIWNERKAEIRQSEQNARRIAREEIQVR